MTKALVTGSFDPITKGHFSLIQVAARAFDRVIVCIFINPDKKYRFTVNERVAFIEAGIRELGLSNVTVDFSSGFVADYAKAHGIGYVVRGVRNSDDMAYELEMSQYNHNRNPDMETLLWPATKDMGISSTKVRESLENGIIPEEMLLLSTVDLLRRSIN